MAVLDYFSPIFSLIVLVCPILTNSVVKIGQKLVVSLTTNLIRKIPKHLPNLATFEPEFLKRSAFFKKDKTCTFLLKS
ncbi:hypothetical protein D1835_10330 [Enterococcus asini]|nr:hypothetical protein [Enterococcus asini]